MPQAHLITVNMGYGHQRTADNLRFLAHEGEVICANDYPGLTENDRRLWQFSQRSYEAISSFQRLPWLGGPVFSLFDAFQKIPPFRPGRENSRPNLALQQIYFFLRRGWGRDLIARLRARNEELKEDRPLLATFFVPAFMAEFFAYPGEIFCAVCDADVSHTWAALKPSQSRIKYLAPTERVVQRLKTYGVPSENVFLTGFPLPPENVGENQEILRADLRSRLVNLDPQKRFFQTFGVLVEKKLGALPSTSDHVLTVLFSVGGAGAQKEIVVRALLSLAPEIRAGKIRLILSAGIRPEVREYFQRARGKQNLKEGGQVEILFAETLPEYFRLFNGALRQSDALWTKPSELSFYAGLGLPLIIAPSLGSHEEFNRAWLLQNDFGVPQPNLTRFSEWLLRQRKRGDLARQAFFGFLSEQKNSGQRIHEIVCR